MFKSWLGEGEAPGLLVFVDFPSVIIFTISIYQCDVTERWSWEEMHIVWGQVMCQPATGSG